MKKILFIFLTFSLFSCGNKNNSTAERGKEIQTDINGLTEFEFTEEMHNFGSLQSGEIVIYTFVFKNTGNNPLIINDVEAGCGCIKTEFSREPVLPGASGNVEVEFDSSGMWGKQFKTIEIHTNTKKPKQLAIFAEVQNDEIEIKY